MDTIIQSTWELRTLTQNRLIGKVIDKYEGLSGIVFIVERERFAIQKIEKTAIAYEPVKVVASTLVRFYDFGLSCIWTLRIEV